MAEKKKKIGDLWRTIYGAKLEKIDVGARSALWGMASIGQGGWYRNVEDWLQATEFDNPHYTGWLRVVITKVHESQDKTQDEVIQAFLFCSWQDGEQPIPGFLNANVKFPNEVRIAYGEGNERTSYRFNFANNGNRLTAAYYRSPNDKEERRIQISDIEKELSIWVIDPKFKHPGN